MVDERLFDRDTIYDSYYFLLEYKFHDIEEYLEEFSTILFSNQRKIQRMWEDPEISKMYEMDISDNEYKYGQSYPNYMYSSLLLIIYGLFENWLRTVCDMYSQSNLCKLNVSDLSGGGYIDRCKKFLELIGEFDLEPLDTEWKKIVLIQKLRNCIAHNNSYIIKNISQPLKSCELYKLVENEERITINEELGNFYINDKTFLLDAMSNILLYAQGIITRINSQKVLIRSLHNPIVNSDNGIDRVENLLKNMVFLLNQLDEMKEGLSYNDKINEFQERFPDMVNDLLKLYAFFSGTRWKEDDVLTILHERETGLLKVKSIYIK